MSALSLSYIFLLLSSICPILLLVYLTYAYKLLCTGVETTPIVAWAGGAKDKNCQSNRLKSVSQPHTTLRLIVKVFAATQDATLKTLSLLAQEVCAERGFPLRAAFANGGRFCCTCKNRDKSNGRSNDTNRSVKVGLWSFNAFSPRSRVCRVPGRNSLMKQRKRRSECLINSLADLKNKYL